MAGLSKSRIIAHRQCPKRLWLQVNRPELFGDDSGVSARIEVGYNVGDVARALHPECILIDAEDLSQALVDTEKALSGEPHPIFEATFQAGGILVRADLLIPSGLGYRMIEVKSSTHVHPYQVEDAAIQSWVAVNSGIRIDAVEIAHIDKTFLYPGSKNYQGLFTHVDVTDEVRVLMQKVPEWADATLATLNGEIPEVEPGDQCSDPFDCPFCGHCCPEEELQGFPPEILPYGRTVAERLRAAGCNDLCQASEDMVDNSRHKRIIRVCKSGLPELDREATIILNELPYPRYYIDFETIFPAIPIWSGTRPYQQIPFQWSCHIEKVPGVLTHHGFLANENEDPRPAFIKSLLGILGKNGPVFVYNAGFERTRLRELAEAYPHLAEEIEAVQDRIYDLLPLARENYYHQDMMGSWSIKALLPTVAPELSYDNLEVGDGGMAMEAFLEILAPETLEERRTQLREALSKYCAQDTLSMVLLARYFKEFDHDA